MNEDREEQVSVFDLFIILLKRKRLILWGTLAFTLLAVVLSLVLSPIYMAEITILPPQQGNSDIQNQLMSALGSAAILVSGGMSLKTPGDLYIAMLTSRTLLDRMVDRFGLMATYKAKFREDARRQLEKALKVEEDKKSRIISIGVYDSDPKKAADMANAFVDELMKFSRNLAVTDAGQRRVYYEEQLKETKHNLDKAEDNMRVFQESTGAIKMDSQTTAVIQEIAKLRAQVAAKEVQFKVLRTYATSQNPDTQKAEEELRVLREQVAAMENKSTGHDPLMSPSRMPAVGLEYLRKMRDLKFNEALYDLMMKQYEVAKMDESRDYSQIQVLDRAIPPEKRAKPKRKLMVLLGMALGLFFSSSYALISEKLERIAADPVNEGRMMLVRKYMRLDRNR